MPLSNPYRGLAIATTELLNCPLDAHAVSAAVSNWKCRDPEEAAAEAGAVIAMVRSTEKMMREAHYTEHPADTPLIELTKTLGMAGALAGPSAGRALALHGADVLNI